VKKTSLREAILTALQRELELQVQAAHLARDEAISEESRAESKFDTHSQEAAYLAESQARIASDIESSIAVYTTLPMPDFPPDAAVGLGALVELGGGGHAPAWYFFGPRNGGLEVQVDGCDVLVLTPQSPLGRQLLGKRVGDAVQVVGRGGTLSPTIRSIV
jgi:transcription elongation GreA/GreB family factor